MAKLGFNFNSLHLILKCLRRPFVRSIKNDIASNWFEVNAEVPQGSILGPLLFNICCSDLRDYLPDAVALCQYANDCQILLNFSNEASFDSIKQKIKDVLKGAELWSKINYLWLNNKKTQTLLIYNRNNLFSNLLFF